MLTEAVTTLSEECEQARESVCFQSLEIIYARARDAHGRQAAGASTVWTHPHTQVVFT